MKVKRIDFFVPDDLAREMEVHSSLGVNHALSFYLNPEHYYLEYLETADGKELKTRTRNLGSSLKILDIGAGMGHSSFYLASLGHQMFVVEPSNECCRIIDGLATKFGYDISVFECSAEDMDRIEESNFDLCIFNSSLHHCYDPVKSIYNCRMLLKNGGRLLVLNELFLKIYQSKKQFSRDLKRNPVGKGHYGGNEHAYYFSEYKKMIAASGFKNIVEFIPYSYYSPRTVIRQKLSTAINGKYVYSDASLLLRYCWYIVINRIIGIHFIAQLLKKLSLITISFQADSPD